METFCALNAHMPSRCGGSSDTSPQLSAGTKLLFWTCDPKQRRPSCSILFQKKSLVFADLSCSGAHRSQHSAFPHASLNSYRRPAAKNWNFDSHDESLLLKKRGAEVVQDLHGKCIFLVGMMGSGKSTIGKILADALGYCFVDSDRVIEEAAGGLSVAEFFKQKDEMAFRAAETNALKQLSCETQLVVATGGGIVVHPENWRYMRCGLSVWLDVPLEALAERVVAAGTHSRPLLGEGERRGTSAYTQALMKLSTIFENRKACYANADTKVSVQKVATNLGHLLCDIAPTVIAMQALEEIGQLLQHRKQNENGLDSSSEIMI